MQKAARTRLVPLLLAAAVTAALAPGAQVSGGWRTLANAGRTCQVDPATCLPSARTLNSDNSPSLLQAVPGCVLELGAGPVEYDRCLLIDGIGSGFWLLWSVLPSSGGATTVRWGMNSSASGYVAFAYPPDPEPGTGECWGQVGGKRAAAVQGAAGRRAVLDRQQHLHAIYCASCTTMQHVLIKVFQPCYPSCRPNDRSHGAGAAVLRLVPHW